MSDQHRLVRKLIPSCTISPSDLKLQSARLRSLRCSVISTSIRDDTLHVVFAGDVDRSLLKKLIATERRCCRFLDFCFDPVSSSLTVSSKDPSGLAALALLHAQFGSDERPPVASQARLG